MEESINYDIIGEGEEEGDDEYKEELKVEETNTVPTASVKSSRHKRRPRVYIDKFPGIERIFLEEKTQKFIECIVGVDVTEKDPWKCIKKEYITSHMEINPGSSEFLPFKKLIMDYPGEEILIGFIVSDSDEAEEFYICFNEDSCQKILEYAKQKEKEQIRHIVRIVHKKILPWKSLGSEKEVDEEIVKCYRPLIEVELVASYPVMSSTVTFRFRYPEQAVNGYAEVTSKRQYFDNILRRRIDLSIQACISTKDNTSQTVSTYPSNTWTQYEFKFKVIDNPSPQYYLNLKQYFDENINSLEDSMNINEHINLYLNDYENLVQNPLSSVVPPVSYRRDFMNLSEVDVCKGKQITSISWHPTVTGIVALSYGNSSLNTLISDFSNEDTVLLQTFSTTPVLVWSIDDALYPRLYLESDRYVTCISFCPYDANVLIGAVSSGQICIWDLRGKFELVETEEILTIAQRNYRTLMHSLIPWMKNIHDIKYVGVAASSDLEYSHDTQVTDIIWLWNNYAITKTGLLEKVPEGKQTMQFATASRDGTILFWDLLYRPKANTFGNKPKKKHRHLKERPINLTKDESPYKELNRNLIPLFKICVNTPEIEAGLPLTSISFKCPEADYEQINPQPELDHILTRRRYFRQIIKDQEEEVQREFVAGTATGDVIHGSWEGFAFNTGEIVNTENSKILNMAKFHDGLVTKISRCKILDVILTVGGKIFALWKEDFGDEPLFWRKSKHSYYSSGEWNRFGKAVFKLCRTDGVVEMWNLLVQSDEPTSEQLIAADGVADIVTHPRKLVKNIMGSADTHGTLRLHLVEVRWGDDERELNQLLSFLNREIDRKTEFKKWQKKWTEKYTIKEQTDDVPVDIPIVTNQKDEGEIPTEIVKPKKQEDIKYWQYEKEQWDKREQERMNRVLLAKKHLYKDKLVHQQKPLNQMAQELKNRKIKQELRLKKGESIFNENVAIYFPEAIKAKALEKIDPYAIEFKQNFKEECIKQYNEMQNPLKHYVKDHPYLETFNWNKVLLEGRERRIFLDTAKSVITHAQRHQSYKEERYNKFLQENAPKIITKTRSSSSSNKSENTFDSELLNL